MGTRIDAGKVVVVRFAGAILDAVSIHSIRRQLFQLVDERGFRNVLLDLQGVRFVSSGALGVLVTFQKKVAAVDGTLVVCHLNRDILDVLEATKLDKLFVACADQADVALTHFGAGSPSRSPQEVESVILRLGPPEEE